jgi:hypothetical protein
MIVDLLEALDMSDSHIAQLFLDSRLKGCHLPSHYDAVMNPIDLRADQV